MTDSYLVPRPRTTEMTFWSRYDPVAQPRRSTDHWTKMKQRAIQYRSLDNPDGIGAPMSMDALQGAMPGSYMYTRPRNSVSRESTRSAFNQRARDGFRYWLIERPKPTSFWKYSFADPRLMPRARRFMPK
ncbi:uncharacterized protein LOC128218044 isoform X4 [Mya arenaria]|uniref:uncharacterized protein LOC128217787 isoform X1 n=1 Tax=Mya arenaria TaxID=6604 RepID=UPI0022E0D3C1|nr:uncharacterized protein LOC128217787 isoform X1 [Mya arenaria]XP_052781522.1 uncharacterized protein LOC128218044 isoform X4 [Mya arenaria]